MAGPAELAINKFISSSENMDEEEEDVVAFPIVKESAGKLLETGLSTLQKTLLLKREVEVDQVSEELKAKREEFKRRMDSCAEKQVEIQKKQQKMKDRVSKFEKFIQENEGKRRRAIQKYQQELKMKEQKHIESDMLILQLKDLKQRHEKIKRKLANYRKYEDYLQRVLEILPAHYLEVNDSMLITLMMRHRTLSETNITLVENLTSISDEVEKLKIEYEAMKDEHNKLKLDINSQFSRKQKAQESKTDFNQEKETKFMMDKVEIRGKRTVFGTILMAIDNLADKCQRKMDPPLEDMDVDEKLKVVEKYVTERNDVAKMAGSGSFDPNMDKKSKSSMQTRTRQKLPQGQTT